MKAAELPRDEAERLAALRRYEVLDTPAEVELDDFTALAAQICGTPIALVSLVDAARQWFKSRVGVDVFETPRDIALCAHAILGNDLLVVPDALEDPRFSDNPLVTGPPHLRFYAGAPLTTPDGHNLGTLCVIDRAPRVLTEAQRDALARLGRQVVARLEHRLALRDLARRRAGEIERDRFFNLSLDLLCIAGVDGYFKRINPSFTRTLGYSEAELLARPFVELVHPDDRPATLAEVEKLARGELTIAFENRYLCKDGSWKWLAWTAQPSVQDNLIYAAARDVTELKKAEDSLRASEANLEVTLRSIGDGVLATDAEGRITLLNSAAERMTGWTHAEARGRPVAEVFRIVHAHTRAPATVRGGYALLEHVHRHVPKTRVLLTTGYLDGRGGTSAGLEPAALLWKPYSRATLLRAMRAALGATSAESPKPRPSVPTASSEQRGRVLLVEDEAAMRTATQRVLAGAGYEVAIADSMAAAKEALAAGRDFAAVVCDLTLGDGSGAGLVHWLRERHPALARRTLVVTGGATDDAGRKLLSGGGVEVLRKPVSPDRLLERLGALARREEGGPHVSTIASEPAAAAQTAALPPSGRARAAEETRSVLLVDDDDSQREAYGRALRAAGFSVTAAGSGEEALALLEHQLFQCVVTDIGLPGADGLATLRAARAKDPDVPVLLITGAPSVETATMAVQSRAVGYLAKPFPLATLVTEVERAVEAGDVLRLQRKLLTARAGAEEYLQDLPATRRNFEAALAGLTMAFQPIVRSKGGSVFGFEALLRSSHPVLSSPPKVLAAAEALGRMDDVGHAVRRAVASTLTQHPGRTETIFVNLHPSELRSELLCAATEPLRRSAARIVLEVTERTSLAMGPQLTEELRLLRAAGYRVAIDDLGEGYAGLSWLAHLRPDVAKIDMSLVRDVHRSPLKREIVGSLISVCRRAGITPLAEGVETADEAQLLTDLGCELLQGYFFAKPGPAFPEVRGLSRQASRG